MAQDNPQHAPRGSRPGTKLYRLQVSNYDRVSGMLLALVTLIGLTVSIMLVLWLTGQFGESLAVAQVEFLPPGDQEDDAKGPSDDIEPPPPEEEIIEEEVVELLEAVIDANATRFVGLKSHVSGDGHGRGGGGTGSGRKGGPRMIVRFPKGSTTAQYARQLDFFGIELAVWDGGKVYYASGLSRARPKSWTDTPENERKRKRLNLVGSDRNELEATDRELLRKAGITSRKRIMKFLPTKWANMLAQLQKNAAGGRKIRSTYFLVVSDGGSGFTFEVLKQVFR